MRVPVKPELLEWARERAGLSREDVVVRFPKYGAWESGDLEPTLKQLEAFARKTHAPIGYFFSEKPPVEKLPIPDFRTMGSRKLRRPSPDLLDTIYLCQRRQDWYRDFARANREDPLSLIGSATVRGDVVATAATMRARLGFELAAQRRAKTWTDALRLLIYQAEEAGILVMCSGVVGSNNHRRLEPTEFRGFALSDDLAPVVFINGSDTKSAQMFTLAHELAHLWLGASGLSDVQGDTFPEQKIERWCNQVAAELLVPLQALRDCFDQAPKNPLGQVPALARRFKVSTLVILRRIHDVGWISRDQLWKAYEAELERLLGLPSSSGGNFYLAQPYRASRRLATSLISSTLSGQTLYTDAFRLLQIKKTKTLHDLGDSLGLSHQLHLGAGRN